MSNPTHQPTLTSNNVHNEFIANGNLIWPFGYMGGWWGSYIELLHLWARWYSPETGTFLSRDPWEGNYLQPQTINGWSYVEGNPINGTDPTGKNSRTYKNYPVQAEVEGIKTVLLPWLFDSAFRHNMSNTNMGDGAFAALVLAIVKRESGQLFMFHDLHIRLTAELFKVVSDEAFRLLLPLKGEEKSLGPGNMKPTTVWELENGMVRNTNTWDEFELNQARGYYDTCVDYDLKPLPYGGRAAGHRSRLTLIRSQNLEYTIDLVGAQLQQGAIYAKFKQQELNEFDEKIGVFNLLAWYNGGLILDRELNRELYGADDGSAARGYADKIIENGLFADSLAILRETVGSPPLVSPSFNYELGDAYYNYQPIK